MSEARWTIAFEPVVAEHYPLLARWLRTAPWLEWWGDPDVELGLIREMVEGRDSSRPFIFRVDGEPLGYIQYWFIGHHQTEDWVRNHPWLGELPPETIGVDLSIGVPDRLAQGVGSAVLRAFVGRLRERGHGEIIIDPDPANTRAIRAYAKAGFRVIPALADKGYDSLIMRHEIEAGSVLA